MWGNIVMAGLTFPLCLDLSEIHNHHCMPLGTMYASSMGKRSWILLVVTEIFEWEHSLFWAPFWYVEWSPQRFESLGQEPTSGVSPWHYCELREYDNLRGTMEPWFYILILNGTPHVWYMCITAIGNDHKIMIVIQSGEWYPQWAQLSDMLMCSRDRKCTMVTIMMLSIHLRFTCDASVVIYIILNLVERGDCWPLKGNSDRTSRPSLLFQLGIHQVTKH